MSVEEARQQDEHALRQCAEAIVSRLGERVVAVRRARSGRSTSYASDVVTVELASGGTVELFLKNFGHSDRLKDEPDSRRERELRVYRDLLAEAELPVPRYYGSVWDEREGRFWLLLEYVRGTAVRYVDFEQWVAAAASLGRLQGWSSACLDRVCETDFLIRHDAGFFISTVEGALRSTATIAPAEVRRLERALDRYERLAGIMGSQPATLVHGAYRPQNILAEIEGQPGRICVADWERAAIGSPLFDFACFADGFDPSRFERLWEAYADELAAAGLEPAPMGERDLLVDSFRLHRVVTWLSRAVPHAYPADKVVELVGMAEAIAAEVA